MNAGYAQTLARRAAAYEATGAQIAYLKRLLDEAFVHLARLGSGLDRHHLNGIERKKASFAIDRIRACRANGWKPLIENDEFWFWRGFNANG